MKKLVMGTAIIGAVAVTALSVSSRLNKEESLQSPAVGLKVNDKTIAVMDVSNKDTILKELALNNTESDFTIVVVSGKFKVTESGHILSHKRQGFVTEVSKTTKESLFEYLGV